MSTLSGTYWCNQCSSDFAELEAELTSEWNAAAGKTVTFPLCPYCGSDELEDAYQCIECDQWYPSTHIISGKCAACLSN